MRALPAGICLLALAACSQPKTPATPAPSGKALPAAAALPLRKAGVWEVKMGMPGLPVTVGGLRRCFAEQEISSEDFRSGLRRRAREGCTQTLTRQSDGSVKMNGECDLPNGGRSKSEGVISGDFQSHYRADITTTVYDTGTPADGERKVSLQADYLGPCPAGVAPGTMLDSDNKPMSRDDMVAAFQARRAARRAAQAAQ